MNKAKMSATKRSVSSPQQLVSEAATIACMPAATQNSGESAPVKGRSGSSFCGIDVRRMAEDAAIIREQKANADKTTELSETRTIEPTGLFNKRTSGW